MKTSATLLDPVAPGVLDLADATQFSPQGIVSRGVIAAPGLRVTLFGFAAGQELTEHTSSSRALIQILTPSSDRSRQVSGAVPSAPTARGTCSQKLT